MMVRVLKAICPHMVGSVVVIGASITNLPTPLTALFLQSSEFVLALLQLLPKKADLVCTVQVGSMKALLQFCLDPFTLLSLS